MPTGRGIGLLALAAFSYVAGRLVGTYELYLVSLSLATLVVLSGVMVLLSGRRMGVRRAVYPTCPMAGDEASLSLELRNDSLLPTAAVRVAEPLGRVASGELDLEVSPLGPRSIRVVRERLPGLRRGVYSLESSRVTMVDPLGLFQRRRRAGDELKITVLPRITPLTSCVFFGGRGLGQNLQTKSSRAHTSLDIRGVRPHQPGEPLSRIDWKSTAKTGALMLRETEEPSRTEVMILLDCSRDNVVGEPPETSFEAVVAAAGSIADYILREGFGVGLLLQRREDGLVQEHFDSRDRGREELLRVLAGAQGDVQITLPEALRRREAAVARGLALVVISSSFERSLLLLLTELRETGLPVYLVHVDGPSFAQAEAAVAIRTEQRRFLLGLQAAGVLSVTLRRGDDLGEVLSFGSEGSTSGRSRAGRTMAQL